MLPLLQAPENDDPNNEDQGEQAYVWGTNINIENIKRRVMHFFDYFDVDNANVSRYMKLIEQVGLALFAQLCSLLPPGSWHA